MNGIVVNIQENIQNKEIAKKNLFDSTSKVLSIN